MGSGVGSRTPRFTPRCRDYGKELREISMSVAPMMVFHVPEDPAWLQAFGRVTIVHAQLDHILRMTIKTLAGITIEVAMDATEREPSSLLRERIRKLAKARLGEGAALLQLQALMERCK